MKKLFLLALLPILGVLPAQSPVFTPFSLTNEGRELLAFPGTEAPQVLYWLKVGPSYRDAVNSTRLILSNESTAEPLRLQHETNKIHFKQPQIAGKIIGGLIGMLFFGLGAGVAISDLKNVNSIAYLGIGAAAGAASFGIGFVFDLGDTMGKIRFISKTL